MKLMRIGAPSSEKPVIRISDDTYIDVSDIVTDFNEQFFTEGTLSRADRAHPFHTYI